MAFPVTRNMVGAPMGAEKDAEEDGLRNGPGAEWRHVRAGGLLGGSRGLKGPSWARLPFFRAIDVVLAVFGVTLYW